MVRRLLALLLIVACATPAFAQSPFNYRSGTANFTNNTAADIIAALGGASRVVVTCVVVTNAHATVSSKVEIRDGTTVKMQPYALAAGGGYVLCPGTPIFMGTANTAITARPVTTGSDIDVFISGYITQ